MLVAGILFGRMQAGRRMGNGIAPYISSYGSFRGLLTHVKGFSRPSEQLTHSKFQLQPST